MTTVLVTGASGLIGTGLVGRVSRAHQLICLSRRPPSTPCHRWLEGRFDSTDDLRRLDGHAIDVLIHLAARTGKCSIDDALDVNVLGTHRLMTCLYHHGCRKFILASSVAAVGCLDERFVPLIVPIPEDHVCLARDAYGLSKALMEEVARHFERVNGGCEVVVFRIGPVIADGEHPPVRAADRPSRPFLDLAHVHISEVVAAIAEAVDAPFRAGFRQLNLVGSSAHCVDPVVDVLRASLGERAAGLDLSWYEEPGREHAPVYRTGAIGTELG